MALVRIKNTGFIAPNQLKFPEHKKIHYFCIHPGLLRVLLTPRVQSYQALLLIKHIFAIRLDIFKANFSFNTNVQV